MLSVERHWEAIASSLLLAVRLLAQFGFSSRSLRTHTIVILIACYLHCIQADDTYLRSSRFQDDRMRIRLWTLRTMLKRRLFSASDHSMIRALRQVFHNTVPLMKQVAFPSEALDTTLRRHGRLLQFSDEELEKMVDSCNRKSVFSILSLLYPCSDFDSNFHIDHIMPRGLVTRAELKQTSIDPTLHGKLIASVDSLANLWLLTDHENLHKSYRMPSDWIKDVMTDEGEQRYFLAKHDIDFLPTTLEDMPSFCIARRERILHRMRGILQ